MITEDDIKELQSKMTEEQYNKLVYYLSKDKLVELKELARKKCKIKFISVMRKYINKFIVGLYSDDSFKRRETINLLKKANKTLGNVRKLIKQKDVVDATCLLRSSFENLIMGMMIYESEDTYKEFIDLSINDETRNYTTPQTLRNGFRHILVKLDENAFGHVSKNYLKKMLEEFYGKMCLLTHSTSTVNAMVELENDNDLYIVILKEEEYFMEFLLYLCLKYLCNYKKNPIDAIYIVVGWYVLITDIPHEAITPEKKELFDKLLYADYNRDYIEKKLQKKSKDNVVYLADEMKKMEEDIKKHPLEFIQILEEILE